MRSVVASEEADKALSFFRRGVESEVREVQDSFNKSSSEWGRKLAALQDESDAAFDASRRLVIEFCFASVIVAALLGRAFSAAIIDPVRQLELAFSALEKGNFSNQVSVYNRDEFGELAGHLNATMRQLGVAHKDLKEANQHKSEFLANISHELRTPLNAIIGFTRIVARNSADVLQVKQMDNLAKVTASAEHLLTLINGMLDLSKIEAGKMDVHAEEFDPAGVLMVCAQMAEPLKGDKPITIHTTFFEDLPMVT